MPAPDTALLPTTSLLFHAIQRAVKILNLKIGDTVVLTGGQVGVNSGHTNMIKVETVRKVYR